MVGIGESGHFYQDSPNGQPSLWSSPLAWLWLAQSCTANWGLSYPTPAFPILPFFIGVTCMCSEASTCLLLFPLPFILHRHFSQEIPFTSSSILASASHEAQADILDLSPVVWYVALWVESEDQVQTRHYNGIQVNNTKVMANICWLAWKDVYDKVNGEIMKW